LEYYLKLGWLKHWFGFTTECRFLSKKSLFDVLWYSQTEASPITYSTTALIFFMVHTIVGCTNRETGDQGHMIKQVIQSNLSLVYFLLWDQMLLVPLISTEISCTINDINQWHKHSFTGTKPPYIISDTTSHASSHQIIAVFLYYIKENANKCPWGIG
jgi:hypothetical protein